MSTVLEFFTDVSSGRRWFGGWAVGPPRFRRIYTPRPRCHANRRNRGLRGRIGAGALIVFGQHEIIVPIDITEATMAGNLHVRNLDDELIARLKRRAARHGRSAEAEHREILRQALAVEAEPTFETLAAELRALTKHRHQTPSEDLLREGRDER